MSKVKPKETIYEYVMRRLQETKGDWSDVARRTGISRRTIEKIARRDTQDPGVSLVQRLSDYFEELDAFEARLSARKDQQTAAVG